MNYPENAHNFVHVQPPGFALRILEINPAVERQADHEQELGAVVREICAVPDVREPAAGEWWVLVV
jgi:hypothetical protein